MCLYSYQLVAVGTTVQRHVSYQFVRPWLIFSYKNLKGRGRRTSEGDEDDDVVELTADSLPGLPQPDVPTEEEDVRAANVSFPVSAGDGTVEVMTQGLSTVLSAGRKPAAPKVNTSEVKEGQTDANSGQGRTEKQEGAEGKTDKPGDKSGILSAGKKDDEPPWKRAKQSITSSPGKKCKETAAPPAISSSEKKVGFQEARQMETAPGEKDVSPTTTRKETTAVLSGKTQATVTEIMTETITSPGENVRQTDTGRRHAEQDKVKRSTGSSTKKGQTGSEVRDLASEVKQVSDNPSLGESTDTSPKVKGATTTFKRTVKGGSSRSEVKRLSKDTMSEVERSSKDTGSEIMDLSRDTRPEVNGSSKNTGSEVDAPKTDTRSKQSSKETRAKAKGDSRDTGSKAKGESKDTGSKAKGESKDTGSKAEGESKDTGSKAKGESKDTGSKAKGESKDTGSKAEGESKDTGSKAKGESKDTGSKAKGESKDTGSKAKEESKDTGSKAKGESKDTGSKAKGESKDTGSKAKGESKDTGSKAKGESKDTGSKAKGESKDTGSKAKGESKDTGSKAKEESKDTGSKAKGESKDTGSKAKGESKDTGSKAKGESKDTGSEVMGASKQTGSEVKRRRSKDTAPEAKEAASSTPQKTQSATPIKQRRLSSSKRSPPSRASLPTEDLFAIRASRTSSAARQKEEEPQVKAGSTPSPSAGESQSKSGTPGSKPTPKRKALSPRVQPASVKKRRLSRTTAQSESSSLELEVKSPVKKPSAEPSMMRSPPPVSRLTQPQEVKGQGHDPLRQSPTDGARVRQKRLSGSAPLTSAASAPVSNAGSAPVSSAGSAHAGSAHAGSAPVSSAGSAPVSSAGSAPISSAASTALVQTVTTGSVVTATAGGETTVTASTAGTVGGTQTVPRGLPGPSGVRIRLPKKQQKPKVQPGLPSAPGVRMRLPRPPVPGDNIQASTTLSRSEVLTPVTSSVAATVISGQQVMTSTLTSTAVTSSAPSQVTSTSVGSSIPSAGATTEKSKPVITLQLPPGTAEEDANAEIQKQLAELAASGALGQGGMSSVRIKLPPGMKMPSGNKIRINMKGGTAPPVGKKGAGKASSSVGHTRQTSAPPQGVPAPIRQRPRPQPSALAVSPPPVPATAQQPVQQPQRSPRPVPRTSQSPRGVTSPTSAIEAELARLAASGALTGPVRLKLPPGMAMPSLDKFKVSMSPPGREPVGKTTVVAAPSGRRPQGRPQHARKSSAGTSSQKLVVAAPPGVSPVKAPSVATHQVSPPAQQGTVVINIKKTDSQDRVPQFDGAGDEHPQPSTSKADSTEDGKFTRPRRKRRTAAEIEAEATHVPQTTGTYQRVRLVSRPWKTPEGTVNRPILKMMMEAVLMFIMSNPGLTRTSICQKYSPILQPVPLFELVEMLEKLGCVTHKMMEPRSRPSLFSQRIPVVPAVADKGQQVLVYSPTVDCILKLGQFEHQLESNRA